jgi:hypothetical protein
MANQQNDHRYNEHRQNQSWSPYRNGTDINRDRDEQGYGRQGTYHDPRDYRDLRQEAGNTSGRNFAAFGHRDINRHRDGYGGDQRFGGQTGYSQGYGGGQGYDDRSGYGQSYGNQSYGQGHHGQPGDCVECVSGVKEVVNSLRVRQEQSSSGLPRDTAASSTTSATASSSSMQSSTDKDDSTRRARA